MKSLKSSLHRSYLFIILVMVIPTVYAVAVYRIHSRRYDTIISNTGRANEINNVARNAIPTELWDIVSGKKKFFQGKQYFLLDEIERGIEEMEKKTETANGKTKLLVAKRTCLTLKNHISELGIQIEKGSTVRKNEEELEEIRSIAALLSDILQEYIIIEIEEAAKTNEAIKTTSIRLSLIQIAIVALVVVFSVRRFLSTFAAIKKPIAEMESLSTKIARGDLSARLSPPEIEELTTLGKNLNTMAERISALIAENIEEQKNLQKAEMKLLQSQITPHFLYNTFDTIIWLAESSQTSDVVKVTRAFSEFLRISLSRGHEWITVENEVSHISNYLTIQKIRYESILNYEIDVPEELLGFKMLKLTLQPLVENAIYHGIKNKRGRGHIKVKASFFDETKTRMLFCVEDDGAGFSKERLEAINEELKKESAENVQETYGLYNVNKRLLLYYDEKAALKIESESGKGARISFSVPCIKKEMD